MRMHGHDDKKKSLLQFLGIKQVNFNIAVKLNIIQHWDEAQLEGRDSDLGKITTMHWC